jgi:hypothetical protein
LLILARTWFAFGLPSKIGCDNQEGDRVRLALVRPPPLERSDTVSEALCGLSLAPRGRHERHRLAPPSKATKIR